MRAALENFDAARALVKAATSTLTAAEAATTTAARTNGPQRYRRAIGREAADTRHAAGLLTQAADLLEQVATTAAPRKVAS